MKNFSKTALIALALSVPCAPAFARASIFEGTKAIVRKAYQAASIGLGMSSYWQTVSMNKKQNQFIPTVQEGNLEAAGICGATGATALVLGKLLLKKGIRVPLFVGGAVVDVASRTIQHQLAGKSGFPTMPHYAAMKTSAMNAIERMKAMAQ